jgi:hypothetical protein
MLNLVRGTNRVGLQVERRADEDHVLDVVPVDVRFADEAVVCLDNQWVVR